MRRVRPAATGTGLSALSSAGMSAALVPNRSRRSVPAGPAPSCRQCRDGRSRQDAHHRLVHKDHEQHADAEGLDGAARSSSRSPRDDALLVPDPLVPCPCQGCTRTYRRERSSIIRSVVEESRQQGVEQADDGQETRLGGYWPATCYSGRHSSTVLHPGGRWAAVPSPRLPCRRQARRAAPSVVHGESGGQCEEHDRHVGCRAVCVQGVAVGRRHLTKCTRASQPCPLSSK